MLAGKTTDRFQNLRNASLKTEIADADFSAEHELPSLFWNEQDSRLGLGPHRKSTTPHRTHKEWPCYCCYAARFRFWSPPAPCPTSNRTFSYRRPGKSWNESPSSTGKSARISAFFKLLSLLTYFAFFHPNNVLPVNFSLISLVKHFKFNFQK
jgi:hypothetical protein